MSGIQKPNGWRAFALRMAVLCLVWTLQPMMKGEYIVALHNGKQLTMTRGIRELQQALVPLPALGP